MDNFEAYSFTVFLFYQTSQVPAKGAAQAARVEYETCRFRAFDLSDLAGPSVGGCSAHAPEPPRAFLFLVEEKEAKDHLGGLLSPLKIPLLGSALAASPDPTAGKL